MKITSLEIKEHEFDKAFRGYSISEVNGFLDDLGREWDKMLNETQLLKMRLEVAEKNAAKFQDMESTLFNTIKNAEENSKKKLETASIQAEQIVSEAKDSAENLISNAEEEAQKMKFEELFLISLTKSEILIEGFKPTKTWTWSATPFTIIGL